MRHRPTDRYATAAAMSDDLRRYLNHRPVVARRTPPPLRLAKFTRRHRRAVLAAIAVVVCFGATALVLKQSQRRYAAQTAADHLAQEQATGTKLYETQIQLAADAWRAHAPDRAVRLLRQAADLRGWEWDFLWRVSDPPFTQFGDRGETTQVMRVSPDGRRLAVGGSSKTVDVYDLTAHSDDPPRPLMSLGGSTNTLFGVDWSPDGKRLMSVDFDGTVCNWDAVIGRLRRLQRLVASARQAVLRRRLSAACNPPVRRPD